MGYLENNKARIWWLDFLRGIALIMMVYFHLVYDLKEFYNLPISYESGINFYIGKVSAILFMLISGISSSLSKSNIKRGIRVLGFALILSLITHLYNPLYGIKFGILHFLGVSMLLSPLFNKINKYILVLLGTSILFLGNFVTKISTSLTFLFPLGITSGPFMSSDYYPLVPWFGLFLYGLALGKFLFAEKRSHFPTNIKDNVISKVGQKTLPIYLLHQPVILIVLFLIDYFIAK